MSCQRCIALALLFSFVLAIAAPVSAWDGGGSGITVYIKDHPWQDDNYGGGEVIVDQIIRVVFGPIVINIKVPVSVVNVVKKSDRKTVTTSKPRPIQNRTQTQTQMQKGQ